MGALVPSHSFLVLPLSLCPEMPLFGLRACCYLPTYLGHISNDKGKMHTHVPLARCSICYENPWRRESVRSQFCQAGGPLLFVPLFIFFSLPQRRPAT